MQSTKILAFSMALASMLMLGACGGSAGDSASDATEAEMSHTTKPAGLPRTSSPEGASVFFISPADGETVANPVKVEFGIAHMTVVKAGEMAADAGHHHLLIDTGLPDLALPVPADNNHRHFGDASTATELTLESGQHTLQLLFADHLHIPHDPVVVSETITITVE
jgi:hypothetical protein